MQGPLTGPPSGCAGITRKRSILLWLLTYVGIIGLVCGQGWGPLLNIVMGLLVLILPIIWGFCDAREHQVCGFDQNSHNPCPVFAIIDYGRCMIGDEGPMSWR